MLNRLIFRDRDEWLVFERPLGVVIARTSAELGDLLKAVQAAVESGLTAAGYVGYEAAPGLDASLVTHPPARLPVACFGLFDASRTLDRLPGPSGAEQYPEWRLDVSRTDYARSIAAIKRQIALGNTYQINYTMRQHADGVTDPWSLFLRTARDAPCAAYLEGNDYVIASGSPELFFELDGNRITCRPMKGTAARGMTTADDQAAAAALRASGKNRAENVMITDMIRNDLGRIAAAGTVTVESLFDVEKYPTVWQMTSTVSAVTDATFPEILAALFPCASVTGAPKASSMAIIAELEDSPRGVYTGTIGWVAPGRQARFSVAIRTTVIDTGTGEASYGVGSGIVWDSDPAEEYDECRIKARALATRGGESDFELLETLLWTRAAGYFLLESHLARMRDSADYFDYPFDRAELESALAAYAAAMTGARHRVRLLLARDGGWRIEDAVIGASQSAEPCRIVLAEAPIDPEDPFLWHKTTRRRVYEQALAAAPGYDDVLLWNPQGLVTETTIANVVVTLGGKRYTPPVSSGLLAGTYRQWLLDTGDVTEREIRIDELGATTDITLVNSVRAAYPARLELRPRTLRIGG
jgi:para-aminobenzoate synthetase/4-amino-4-deoxychorismate lyase